MASGTANAATLTSLPGFTDNDFRDLCGPGEACETAVAEIRAPGRTSWELDARNHGGSASDPGQANFSGASGDAFAFSIAYDSAAGTMELAATQANAVRKADRIDLDRFGDTADLLVRLRSQAGTSSLTDLAVNGGAIGDFTVEAVDGASTQYARIGGIEVDADFTITGNFLFDYSGNNPQSQWATQFKFTDIAPVPVPAALPLLVAALGGMGLVARRRKV